MIVETDAIILQIRKFGDTSKIAVLYTKELGKISIIAKGAYSTKSKFGGALEPLSYSHISIYQKPHSTLHLLKTIETVTPLHKIYKNYNSLIIGLLASEFLSNVQAEEQPNPNIFHCFVNYLQLLNVNNYDIFALTISFLCQLSDLIGYYVDFSFTNDFSDNSLELLKISIENAKPIITNKADYHIFSVHLLKKIHLISKIHFEDLSKVELSLNEFKEFFVFFRNFFSFHLDKKIVIKSIDLLF